MTPRNRRLLEALVVHDKISVSELRFIIGALNPAQNVLSLRQNGWRVLTGRIETLDRDGKSCHPGFYYFDVKERERAIAFLKEADGTGRAIPKAEKDASQDETSRIHDTIRREK